MNIQQNNSVTSDICQGIVMDKESVLTSLENIPEELKVLKQWGVWASVCQQDKKKPAKRLMSAKLRRISPISKDYRYLDDFDVAFETLRERYHQQATFSGEKWNISGMGFVLTDNDPFVIVDVDDCIKDGLVSAEAQEIIDHFNAPTEISYSGKGIHIICKGKLPGTACRKGNFEIYEKDRFFALTGRFIHD